MKLHTLNVLTEDEAADALLNLFDFVCAERIKDGLEVPGTWIALRRDPMDGTRQIQLIPPPPPFDSWGDVSKDVQAFLVKAALEMLEPDFVIQICEAYIINEHASSKDASKAAAFIAAGGSLGDYPGREEIILASLNGATTSRIWKRQIHADGTLGDIVEFDSTESCGRFHDCTSPLRSPVAGSIDE